MKLWISVFLMVFVNSAMSGEAENITACANKAKTFSGVTLDPFIAKYEGNIIAMSIAQWPNVYCEVKLAEVYTLQINNRIVVYKGYAGKESYDLNAVLQARTEEAIRQMQSRIALLELRAKQVSNSLQKPNSNHSWLTKYVEDGIKKSLGTQGANSSENSSTANNQRTVKNQSEQPVTVVNNAGSTPEKQNEIPIPLSSSGDKGKYFLLEAKYDNGLIKTLHKRVGIDTTGYTRTEVNCSAKQYRVIGYSEVSPSHIEVVPSNWTDIVEGSSKSDLVNFVCN